MNKTIVENSTINISRRGRWQFLRQLYKLQWARSVLQKSNSNNMMGLKWEINWTGWVQKWGRYRWLSWSIACLLKHSYITKCCNYVYSPGSFTWYFIENSIIQQTWGSKIPKLICTNLWMEFLGSLDGSWHSQASVS